MADHARLRFAGLITGLILAACGGSQTERAGPPSELQLRIYSVENGLIPVGEAGAAQPLTVADRMKHYGVPGVSVAVIEHGRIDWARGYGVLEAGRMESVDTATLFQSGSISKPVTTVAALRLVEQGTLSLDQDVNDRLASWKVPASEYTTDQKVTLRRILTHSAGLTVHGFAGYTPDSRVPTLLDVLDGRSPSNSAAIRVSFVPGSEQRYSGGGFTVAQLLIAEGAGRRFDEALHEIVLAPAGMVHSTFTQPLPTILESRAASGHQRDGRPVRWRWRIHPEQAAAGLWSTPSDLARLAIEIQRAAAGENNGTISREMAEEMLTKQIGPSVLGFIITGDDEYRVFRHGGANVGYRAQMVAYVEGGRGAVVMTNGEGGMELTDEIILSIARTYGWPTP